MTTNDTRLTDLEAAALDDADQQRARAEAAEADLKAVAANNDRLRAQVAELADQLHKANAQIHSLEKATTAYANENADLRKQICLIVSCSDCGEALEWDGSIPHFRSLDEAKDMLDDEGWRLIGGKPMCGDCCHYKAHEFKPEQPGGLTCERCDLEEDDHEQAAEKAEVA